MATAAEIGDAPTEPIPDWHRPSLSRRNTSRARMHDDAVSDMRAGLVVGRGSAESKLLAVAEFGPGSGHPVAPVLPPLRGRIGLEFRF